MREILLLTTLFLSTTFAVLAGDGSWSQRSQLNDVLIGLDYSMISPTWSSQETAVYSNRVGLLHLDYTRKNQSDLSFGNEWRIWVTVLYMLEGSSNYIEKTLEISSIAGKYQYSDYVKFGVPLNGYSAHVSKVLGEYNDGMGNWTIINNPQNDHHFPLDIDFRLELKEEIWYDLGDVNTTPELSVLNFNATNYRAHWGYFEGAEQYDFEWVWIDEKSAEANQLLASTLSSDPFDLKEPTRVRVCNTHHTLDKTYAEGTLYFRVRAVSKYLNGNQGVYDQVKEGEWTYLNGQGNIVSHVVTDVFEKEKNWLYGVAYAEDGKSVSSVTFYDGSNRGRQSLTYNTSDDITLIGESKFDFEGRQTVSVVPAPVKGRSLGYRTKFNLAFDQSEFNESDFDLSYYSSSTAVGAPPVSLSSTLATEDTSDPSREIGAAQYFSGNNQFDEDLFRAAIPEANGYVYSQTVYRNDGTGRIEEIGGIGETFQVGGAHSVKTYYGSTNQTELIRLFGSNASSTPQGYRKEMVRDANGQHSVTYYDKRGNVIATALSGESPTSLLELDGQAPVNIVTSLNDNNIAIDPYTMISEHTHLNSVENSDITLNYDVNGIVNQLSTIPVDVNGHTVLLGDFCSTCRYDLTIEVIDQNGDDLPNSPFDVSIDPSGNCYDASGTVISGSTGIGYTIGALIYTLPTIGEYRIIKTLSVNQEAMQAAFDAQLDASGANDPTDFINDYISNIDISGCFTNCDDYCYWYKKFEYDQKFGVGSWMALDTLIKLDSMAVCTATACDIDEMYENFDSETSGASPTISPMEQGCAGYRLQMLSQISPGGVFYDTPLSGFWADVASAAPIDINGTSYSLVQLQDPANFFPDMAETLLQYHKEYCHLEDCNDWAATMDYSQALVQEINGTAWPATINPVSGSVFDKPYSPSPSIVTPLEDYGNTNPPGDPFLTQVWNTSATTDLQGIIGDYYNYLDNTAGLPILCSPASTLTSGAPLEFGATNSTLFHYVNHVVNCIEQGNEATLPSPILLSGDYYNYQRRLMFKGIYDQVKMELITAYQNGIGNCPYQTDANAVFMGAPTQAEMEQEIAGALSGVVNSTNCAAQAYQNTVDWIDDIAPNCISALTTSLEHNPSFTQSNLTLGTAATLEQSLYDYVLATCATNPLCLFFNPDVNDANFDPLDPLSPGAQTASEPGEAEYIAVYQLLTGCNGIPPFFEVLPAPQSVVINATNQTFLDCIGDFTTALSTGFNDLYTLSLTQPFGNCGGTPAQFSECLSVSQPINLVTTDCNITGSIDFYLYRSTNANGTTYGGSALLTGVGSCAGKIDLLETTLSAPIVSVSNPVQHALFDDPSLINPLSNIITLTATLADGNMATIYLPMLPCLDSNDESSQVITFPEFPSLPDYESDCIEATIGQATINAENVYDAILNDLQNQFQEAMSSCITSASENFTMSYELKEYQYTLYYYDLAGNLVQTVPPQGVRTVGMQAFPGGIWNGTEPPHKMETRYKYNGLNTLIAQYTPDGGHSDFILDELYRVRYSQNARQFDESKASYTKYDELGRVSEAGEMALASINNTLVYLETKVEDNTFPATTRLDHTITYYEESYPFDINNEIATLFTNGQNNLRNTIGAIEHVQLDPGANINQGGMYRTVISYSYDPHKNVQEMVSTNYHLNTIGQGHKTVRYDYDLISGNVNELIYQEDRLSIQLDETLGQEQEELYSDEFRHKYHYDANNRLVRAFTSKDGGCTWDKEAKYFYYLHGALARTELGEDEVQGCDYAYNLQGWLKGVNASSLVTSRDLGGDGHTGHNKYFGADAHGFMLSYFDNDYESIGSITAFADISAVTTQNVLNGTDNPSNLYNGNIHNMVTALRDENEVPIDVLSNNYQYDQLQRIRSMNVYYSDQAMSTNKFTNAGVYNNGAYRTSYEFDKNGNLKHLSRHGDDGNAKMDEFTYNYYTDPTFHTNNGLTIGSSATTIIPSESNRLANVQDLASLTTNYADIDVDAGQSGTNYEYDASGQLKSDEQEGIEEIIWSVTGKVKEIRFAQGSGKNDLKFVYDPMDMRVMKIERLAASQVKYTYYSCDAQGNVLATYERMIGELKPNPNQLYNDELRLTEFMVYGSSRLGVYNQNQLIAEAEIAQTNPGNTDVELQENFIWTTTQLSEIESQRIVGHKYYELSNHLGNVLEVISDKKIGIQSVDYELDLSTLNLASSCPTSNVGDWTDIDGSNVVSDVNNDGVLEITITGFSPNGGGQLTIATIPNETYCVTYEVVSLGATTPLIGSWVKLCGVNQTLGSVNVHNAPGVYSYTFTATDPIYRLGWIVGGASQSFTLSNISISGAGDPLAQSNTHYSADVVSYSDYYPYGMLLPGRHGSEADNDYRYSFQGQESDDEVKGKGNSVNYKYRMHDPRIGRFFACDPLETKYPWYTPYQFSGNKVIAYVELEGLEESKSTGGEVERLEGEVSDIKSDINQVKAQLEKLTKGLEMASGKSATLEENTSTLERNFLSTQFELRTRLAVANLKLWAMEYDRSQLQSALNSGASLIDRARSMMYHTKTGIPLNYGPELKSSNGNDTYNNGFLGFSDFLSVPAHGLLEEGLVSSGLDRSGASAVASYALFVGSLAAGKIGLGKSNWMGKGKGLLSRGSDGPTIRNSQRSMANSKSGWYDVVIHGAKDGNGFILNGNVMSPKDLARSMYANGYKSGTRIRLISCHSGSLSNGAAYQLSRYTRSMVVAPTGRTMLSPKSGKWIVESGFQFSIFK